MFVRELKKLEMLRGGNVGGFASPSDPALVHGLFKQFHEIMYLTTDLLREYGLLDSTPLTELSAQEVRLHEGELINIVWEIQGENLVNVQNNSSIIFLHFFVLINC
jgi:hypothetical protein